MTVKSYNITLTFEEIKAIHKILGRLSDVEKKEKDLTDKECRLTSEIFNELAYIAYSQDVEE